MNHTTKISKGGLEPYSFEIIDEDWARSFTQSYQTPVIWLSVTYALLTFFGRELMRNRKPFDLKGPLVIWNAFLAIFSTACFLRTLPGLMDLLWQKDGLYKSVCIINFGSETDHFWAFAYTMTKPLEFIDTAFIILRKAPLLFLHWYHHLSMAIFTFYAFPIGDPVTRYGGILNSGVHGIMYTYYALKVAGFNISRRLSSKITTIQLGQFVITFLANVYTYFVILVLKRPCTLSPTTVVIQLIGTLTYGGLFANYYYHTYVKPKPKKA